LLLLPFFAWWYIRAIPPVLWASARGAMPTATHFALFACVLLGGTLLLALLALLKPTRLHLAFSLLLAVVAFGAMDSFEFVRESVRKPFVIENYLYANSLYFAPMPGDGGFTVDNIGTAGVLKTAKWVENRDLTPANQVAAGREIFRVECESCHTANRYRGVHQYIVKRQWDQDKLHAMLGVLFMMHNNVMPQFAGTDAELNALSAYLGSLQPMHPPPDLHPDGRKVFEQNCSMCHQVRPDDHLFTDMPKDPQTAIAALSSLPAMFPIMPDLKMSEDERHALVQWVNTQRPAQAAQGGN
jgi:mono/diheme cytochrome c family protein